jgi:hypothetical protein
MFHDTVDGSISREAMAALDRPIGGIFLNAVLVGMIAIASEPRVTTLSSPRHRPAFLDPT